MSSEISQLKRVNKAFIVINVCSTVIFVLYIIFIIVLIYTNNYQKQQEVQATVVSSTITSITSNDMHTLVTFEYTINEDVKAITYEYKGDYDVSPVCVNADYVIEISTDKTGKETVTSIKSIGKEALK